mmetsp:Transcript_35753/g.89166  ORF Transcript_35753/g.89166 Transcript_35753/m.89166 type:complete len:218 (-) Transcript_35753:68-721(-)
MPYAPRRGLPRRAPRLGPFGAGGAACARGHALSAARRPEDARAQAARSQPPAHPRGRAQQAQGRADARRERASQAQEHALGGGRARRARNPGLDGGRSGKCLAHLLLAGGAASAAAPLTSSIDARRWRGVQAVPTEKAARAPGLALVRRAPPAGVPVRGIGSAALGKQTWRAALLSTALALFDQRSSPSQTQIVHGKSDRWGPAPSSSQVLRAAAGH